MTSLPSALRRAVSAVKRHGVGKILHFTRASIAERGVRGYFRFAMARLSQPYDAAAANAARAVSGGVEITVTTLPSAQPDPAPATATLAMDDRYSWNEVRWNAYMGPLFINRLHHRLNARQKSPPIVLVVLNAVDGDPAQSLTAINNFQRAGEFQTEVLVLDAANPGALKKTVDGVTSQTMVLFLQAGDEVRPELAPALKLFVTNRTEVFSFDSCYREDKRIHPLFMPGANPVHALAIDYLFSRFAMRAGAVAKALADGVSTPHEILKHWITRHAPSQGRAAWTHADLPLALLNIDTQQVRTMRAELLGQAPRPLPWVSKKNKVSVVICTKDKGHLLRQLIRSLFQTTGDLIQDIIIVSNNTTNLFAKQTLDDIARDPRIQILQYKEGFNFSRQSNMGAVVSDAPYILFLNDDITPVSDHWLAEMVATFDIDDVGIVAPLLIYPDERVQHAGMFLGYNNVAGHGLRFASLPDEDYIFYASAPRETSCVSGAAMLVSRECYDALNGFDELLASYLQDVDLCLRARNVGYRTVFTPKATLIHMESASVQSTLKSDLANENRGREHALFFKKWGKALQSDPFHNSNFDTGCEQLRVCAAP